MSTIEPRYVDGSYLESNPSWHLEDSEWKASKVVQVLDGHLPAGPVSIVEIGCGAGGVVAHTARMLHTAGTPLGRVTGFDIAPDAVRRAKELFGSDVEYRQEDFTATTDHFSLGLLIDVVEHVEKPVEFLRACARHVDQLVLHIPLEENVEFRLRGKQEEQRRNVGHLHFFDIDSALKLCRDAGLEVISFRFTCGSLELLHVHGTWKSYLAAVPRGLGWVLNRRVASRVFGHFSVMVLTRTGTGAP